MGSTCSSCSTRGAFWGWRSCCRRRRTGWPRSDLTMSVALEHGGVSRSSGDGFDVLELQYQGGLLGMAIVLPTKADGLAAVRSDDERGARARWREPELGRWVRRARAAVPGGPSGDGDRAADEGGRAGRGPI